MGSRVRLGSSEPAPSSPRDLSIIAAARTLGLDAATATIFAAFRAAGLDGVLLKGPVTARWLYGGDRRPYSDIDILVPRAEWARHERLLRDLGFHELRAERFHSHRSGATIWKRNSDQVVVDLQVGFWGASASSERQWELISAGAEEMTLAGTTVPIPGPPARAFQVAVHAAKDGSGKAKPMEDLRRAVVRLSIEEWRAAAELAAELGGLDAFAWGLLLTDDGARVADELGLATRPDAEMILRNEDAARLSRWFSRDRSGIRQKLGLLVDFLVPTPFALKMRYGIARRGSWGVALMYLFRPIHLLWRLATVLPRWRAAHRRARG